MVKRAFAHIEILIMLIVIFWLLFIVANVLQDYIVRSFNIGRECPTKLQPVVFTSSVTLFLCRNVSVNLLFRNNSSRSMNVRRIYDIISLCYHFSLSSHLINEIYSFLKRKNLIKFNRRYAQNLIVTESWR